MRTRKFTDELIVQMEPQIRALIERESMREKVAMGAIARDLINAGIKAKGLKV